MTLHQIESRILTVLSGRMSAQEVAKKAGIPLGSVLSFAESLKEKQLVVVSSEKTQRISPSEEGRRFLAEGFPEQQVLGAALRSESVLSLSPEGKSVGLPWALRNGWVKVESGKLAVAKKMTGEYHIAAALSAVASGKPVSPQDLATLANRKLISQSLEKTVFLEKAPSSSGEPTGQAARQVNAITREMLLSGEWKKAELRPYDVSAPVEVPSPAMRHMVSRLKNRIAGIFTDMGFEEMEGPEIQSSFWNFDALFQPQDHPARDLADTFYLKDGMPLPKDAKLLAKVKKVHEEKWGGKWSEHAASRAVLRTHTTALSARYLHERCQDGVPRKFFAIGRVYRNEATDYKHLAEFFQVEGIVVWEQTTFRDLLGCLKEFYRKLGFEKIRFQPSYFPYTEPSLEVSVYFEKKRQWLELGGAGIFRPEVSIPLCGRYPVLAWGLSLERPLMLLNDMDDIRDFYRSNVGWLRKQKL